MLWYTMMVIVYWEKKYEFRQDLLKWVDTQIVKKRFAYRTHAVEFALQKLKEEATKRD